MAYNPDGVQQMLDEGVPDSPWRGPIEDWVDLFAHYSQYANDWTFADQSGRPTLGPWMVVQSRYEGDGHIILERNPYYWKVDTEGNQLPYIDRIEATGFEDYESMLLSVLEGNFDTLKDPGAEDRGLFMESQDISHLAIYNSPSDGAGSISIHINQTISDPTKAAIYGDRNFRIGMSYATNRQQIIDLIYNGNGTPRQIAPVESSPLYNEQLATQYLDYDLDLANQYLDMVIPDRDSDGYRLMPNGERMTVNFSVTDEYGMSYPLVAELLMQQWEQVGIGVTIEQITPDDRRARELDNSLEAMIYTAEGGVGINAILDARYFVPVNRSSYYASGWALWYLFGDTNEYAVEPPDTIKQIFAQYELVRGTADPERRIELMQELLQMSADEFFVMGVSNPQDRYGAINENIGNVPQTWYDGFIPGMQSITQHDQWYFKQ
jgi:peptide/nickel transport system substrate-binding protein